MIFFSYLVQFSPIQSYLVLFGLTQTKKGADADVIRPLMLCCFPYFFHGCPYFAGHSIAVFNRIVIIKIWNKAKNFLFVANYIFYKYYDDYFLPTNKFQLLIYFQTADSSVSPFFQNNPICYNEIAGCWLVSQETARPKRMTGRGQRLSVDAHGSLFLYPQYFFLKEVFVCLLLKS